VVAYIRRDMFRRDAVPAPGHNALGGWAVAIMILMLLAQAGLGLFAVDIDGIESGPFSYLVEFETGRRAAELHELTFNLLLGLIGLHLAAVAFYLVYRRTNLLGAMITGARQWPGEQPLLHFRAARLVPACHRRIAGLGDGALFRPNVASAADAQPRRHIESQVKVGCDVVLHGEWLTADHRSGAPTTPAEASRAISPSLRPSTSRSTSAVSSPDLGGARR
jgi:hypothetical protein